MGAVAERWCLDNREDPLCTAAKPGSAWRSAKPPAGLAHLEPHQTPVRARTTNVIVLQLLVFGRLRSGPACNTTHGKLRLL
jgi:hypothetical protein